MKEHNKWEEEAFHHIGMWLAKYEIEKKTHLLLQELLMDTCSNYAKNLLSDQKKELIQEMIEILEKLKDEVPHTTEYIALGKAIKLLNKKLV